MAVYIIIIDLTPLELCSSALAGMRSLYLYPSILRALARIARAIYRSFYQNPMKVAVYMFGAKCRIQDVGCTMYCIYYTI